MRDAGIQDEQQAKEYILEGLKDKYGEEFVIDSSIRAVNKDPVSGNGGQYMADSCYPSSDPSKGFRAECSPSGWFSDNYAKYIFKEDAEDIGYKALADTGFLAGREVVLQMYQTTRTWHEGDPLEEFLGEGGDLDPYLEVRLYLRHGLSEEDMAHQIWLCSEAMRATGRSYELRACLEGESTSSKDCFFLYSTTANKYILDIDGTLKGVQSGIRIRDALREHDAE